MTQQSPLLYSANLFICAFFFYLFIYFIVIANIIFFKSIAWNLLSQIPYSVSVSVSVIPFPFPDSGFRVLVLLMISPLSEGWFIYHCFHGTAVSLKMDSYKIQMQRKSLKVSCVLDINFCLEGLIIFFLFSSQQRMCPVVAKFLEDLRYLIGTFNSQRILS